MNKLTLFHDKKSKKLVNKEIKRGTPSFSKETNRMGDALFLESVKNRYQPKKKAVKMATRKVKTKHSKRTTPGEIIGKGEASPHFAQIEGSRWSKVLTLQNKVGTKRLAKKSNKSLEKAKNRYQKNHYKQAS